MLEKNLDKVNWYILSSNLNAIPILEKNLDKVDWGSLSRNSNIFAYDYNAIKNRMFKNDGIKEALI
jgi:hypothetical protein